MFNHSFRKTPKKKYSHSTRTLTEPAETNTGLRKSIKLTQLMKILNKQPKLNFRSKSRFSLNRNSIRNSVRNSIVHNKTLSLTPKAPKKKILSESDCLKNEISVLTKMVKELKFKHDKEKSGRASLEMNLKSKEDKIKRLGDKVNKLSHENSMFVDTVNESTLCHSEEILNYKKIFLNYEEKISNYQRKVKIFEEQKLNWVSNQKDLEVKIEDLKEDLGEKKISIDTLEEDKKTLENDLNNLMKENKRLRNLVVERDEKITVLKEDLSEIEEKIVEVLQKKINALVIDNESLLQKVKNCRQEEKIWENEKYSFTKKINFLEGKISILEGEKEEKDAALREKEGELVKNRIQIFQLKNEVESFEKNFGMKINEMQRLKFHLNKIEADNELIDKTKSNLENELFAVGQRNKELIDQIHTMEQEAMKAKKEQNDLNQKLESAQKMLELSKKNASHNNTQIEDMIKDVSNLKSENLDLKHKIDLKDLDMKNLKERLGNFENKYKEKQQEIKKHDGHVKELNARIMDLELKENNFSKEKNQSIDDIHNLRGKNELLANELELIKKKFSEANEKKDEMGKNIISMSKENITFKHSLNESVQELDDFKRTLQRKDNEIDILNSAKISLETKIKNLTESNNDLDRNAKEKNLQIQNFENQIKNLKNLIEDLKRRISECESKATELSSIISTKEKIILNFSQKEKSGDYELESLRRQIKELKGKNIELESMVKGITEESRIIVKEAFEHRDQLLREIQKLEFVTNDRLKEIEEKSWVNEKLMIKLSLCYMELERVTRGRDFAKRTRSIGRKSRYFS